ncbi:MAG: hypothetical protein OXI73_14400, partial [Rhodospirillales bacterium]|nr:hypothetical protein [Rhodospirillales bacterium]
MTALADRCIAVDPHGVLHHGDVDRLGLDRARNLLDALKESRSLISRPPYRRPVRHPASGLMRVELKEDVLGVIELAGLYVPLALILPEVLPGTDLAPKLKTDLVAMLFDGNQHYEARSCAWKVLHAIDDSVDWKGIIYRLLAMEDRESELLAPEVAAGIGADSVSSEAVLDTALACLGLATTRYVAREPFFPGQLPAGFPGQIDAMRGAELLDGLAEHARPVMDAAPASARAGIADLVRRLVARVIELEPSTEADRVWGWIGWLDGNDGRDNDVRKRLATTFRENEVFRAALLRHVLLGPDADSPRVAGRKLAATQLDLYPSSEDLAGILTVLGNQTGSGPIDTDTWRGLLLLDQSAGGLPVVLHDAAVPAANGSPGLLAIVNGMVNPADLQRRAEEEERKSREQVERQRVRQRHRNAFAKQAVAIAAGDVEVLELPAKVYLGLPSLRSDSNHLFDAIEAPEGRLRTFLGDALSSQVLDGFIAVLGRDDLPNDSEVSRMRFENRPFAARFPMLCGVAEMLRRGLRIDGVKRATLAAAYMALPPSWRLFRFEQMGVSDALEKVLFRSDADWEAYFRVSIEPQLTRNVDSVDRLTELTLSHRHPNLAGRLAVEWLGDYPALSPSRREQLLACALKNSDPETLRELVIDCRPDIGADDQTRLFWLSSDYLADFDDRREVLEKKAAGNPDFLWYVLDRIVPAETSRLSSSSTFETGMARLSVAQLAFIVAAFGANWPAGRPGAATPGGRHPRDAAKFIDCAINAIAGHPTPEATEALEALSAGGPPSYMDTVRRALKYQQSVRKARASAAPTVGELRVAMTNDLPENIDDMRAWFADQVEMLQERIRGSSTNMWEVYRTESGKPRNENFCRDRMIEQISQHLSPSIRLEREGSAPGNTRMDIA